MAGGSMLRQYLHEWKTPSILLGSLGIASLGDFIYLVAINIIVYQMTGSAAAVAGLWVIGPLTNIVTKFWTGSSIDYRSKKNMVMLTSAACALFIAFTPFAPKLLAVYAILAAPLIAKFFVGPASMTHFSMLVS